MPPFSFDRSGRVLVVDLFALGGSVAGFNRDPAWLHCLRHLPHQVDLQKSVLERGSLHLDVVGQAKLTPERTAGDALVEILVLTLLTLTAFHREHVLFCRHGDLFGREPGKRQ